MAAAQIEDQYFDFGDAWSGAQIEHTFELSNPFQQPLVVRSVVPSCACTVLGPTPSTIPTGGSVRLPIRLSLAGAPEDFASEIVVGLQEHRPVLLHIKGRVIAPFPPLVRFERFHRGSDVEQVFRLRSRSNESFKVKDCRFDPEKLVVEFAQDRADPHAIVVRVRPAPTVPYGQLESEVIFTTSDPENSRMTVMVTGYAREQLELQPGDLSFGLVKTDETATSSIILVSVYDQPIELDRVEIPPNSPIVFDGAVSDSTRTKIRLDFSLKGKFQRELLHGEVVAVANLREQQQVTRRIRFFAMRAD